MLDVVSMELGLDIYNMNSKMTNPPFRVFLVICVFCTSQVIRYILDVGLCHFVCQSLNNLLDASEAGTMTLGEECN